MGSLRKLNDIDSNVHLLLTSSSLSEMYIYDILKKKCDANTDSIFDISTKSSVNTMLDLIGVQPFLAEKWLFVVNYSKVKNFLKGHSGVFKEDTAEFLIKVKNYKEFKEAKKFFGSCNDIYLSYIKFFDVEFLLGKYNLSSKLIEFISKSYYSDPEQVFAIMKELDNGGVITERKHITALCGVSTGSLNSYAISLLKEKPNTLKGQKTVCRNRIRTGLELAEVYGFNKMRNFLMACVKDILDIKQLYLAGAIYDRIRDLPDIEVTTSDGSKVPVYDEKRLSRYSFYLKTIIDTPIDRILQLYLLLKQQGRWYRDIDMINFVYQYYQKGV